MNARQLNQLEALVAAKSRMEAALSALEPVVEELYRGRAEAHVRQAAFVAHEGLKSTILETEKLIRGRKAL